MAFLQRLTWTTRNALGLRRRIREEEFREWRRQSTDPVVRSGRCYVPMPGLERTRHYTDKQNLHHLGRYEWAERVIALGRERLESVLDCACGVGYGTAMLARAAGSVDGVDGFAPALRLAKLRYDRPNIRWRMMDVADLRSLYDEASFDAIVSFQTIESVEDDLRFLDDLQHLLKPGGWLLIDTPVRRARVERPDNPNHRRYYAADEWIDLLVSRFSTVEAFDSLPEAAFLERCRIPRDGSIARCTK